MRIKSKSSAAKPPRKRARSRKSAPRHQRAIETALAALAHDIRTPLTGILALAELLAASELGEREQAWARAVKSAAEHLAQLTTIVCDGVRAEAVGLALREEVFSPRQLAEDLGASLSARAQTSGLVAEVAIAADLPERVIGDAARLRSAVENLIDNAVKFTARGVVKLGVSASRAAAGKSRLTFAVTDSGIGLTPGEIKKLFRPFAQASEAVSRRYGGTGLGLTLVKRLARTMGGDLKVSSAPRRGSTFRLDVVVRLAPADSSRGKSGRNGRRGVTPLAGRRILCVEDSPYGRVVLNTILRELGHHADFVASGEAALEALKRGYDLVLMDVTLTGIDGFETTRRIRSHPAASRALRVIGISARSDAADQARAAGMDAYLIKPVSPAALAEAIGQSLNAPAAATQSLTPLSRRRAPRSARRPP